MEDWTSFFFTGANVLPLFMVATNSDSLTFACLVYVVLLFCGLFAAVLDEDSPTQEAEIREALRKREEDRHRR